MSDTPALSRKDMREPDRFQNVANQAAAWLAARKKLIALVGGAVAVVVIAAGVVSSMQASKERETGVVLSKVLKTANAMVLDVPKPAPGTFKTEEEKQKAVIAEADKLLADHGVSRTTVLAVLAKANAHYALKEWDAASAAYEQFLGGATKEDSLRFLALGNLGMVAEAKGDLAAAAQAFERMAKEAPAYADRADLDRARVLAASGKVDDAKQILTKFAEVHKESPLQREASEQLAKLGAK
jgi:tetratricopeptide (TPR) repeat protein